MKAQAIEVPVKVLFGENATILDLLDSIMAKLNEIEAKLDDKKN